MPSELGSKWPTWLGAVDETHNSGIPSVKLAVGWPEIEAIYSLCRQVLFDSSEAHIFAAGGPGLQPLLNDKILRRLCTSWNTKKLVLYTFWICRDLHHFY